MVDLQEIVNSDQREVNVEAVEPVIEGMAELDPQEQLQRQLGQRYRRIADEMQRKQEALNQERDERRRARLRILGYRFEDVVLVLLKSIDVFYRYRHCIV